VAVEGETAGGEYLIDIRSSNGSNGSDTRRGRAEIGCRICSET